MNFSSNHTERQNQIAAYRAEADRARAQSEAAAKAAIAACHEVHAVALAQLAVDEAAHVDGLEAALAEEAQTLMTASYAAWTLNPSRAAAGALADTYRALDRKCREQLAGPLSWQTHFGNVILPDPALGASIGFWNFSGPPHPTAVIKWVDAVLAGAGAPLAESLLREAEVAVAGSLPGVPHPGRLEAMRTAASDAGVRRAVEKWEFEEAAAQRSAFVREPNTEKSGSMVGRSRPEVQTFGPHVKAVW